MKIYHQKSELKKTLSQLRHQGESVGLVPTMGALHQGHMTLVKRALSENDYIVVSVFVNPTQFDNPDDLEKYPRTLESDIKLLQGLNDSILVYAPSVDDIYGDNVVSKDYSFDGLEHAMEGKYRTGHFDGVGTIVKCLFDIVEPVNAYFGEKDFQQLMIIKKLVDKYKIPVNIVGCPIHREQDGLAMSSRNIRLKPEYRKAAPFIYKTLLAAKEKFGTESANKVTEWVEKAFEEHPLLELEYFTIADTETLSIVKRKTKNKTYRAFIAVYAGDIRLIDNIALN